jgi:group I intron endonuclease
MKNNIASGIYQIINLRNNKCYIGLSRNINYRWRQHTFRVQEDIYPKNRIRAAFKKYGLNQTVSKPGIYDNFEFKILEKCTDDLLFDREKFWIDKIKPDYNCDLETLPKYYQSNHKRKEKQIWVQYHNFEKEDGYPSNDILKSGKNYRIWQSYHYISSKKRSILYSQGDTIYLIVGIGKKSKQYFLWSKTIVEEVDFLEDEYLIYNAFGEQFYLDPPQLLNLFDGFKEFLKLCGNFGFGFSNITKFDFVKTIEKLSNKFRLKKESIFYQDFVKKFEIHYSIIR